MMGGSKPRRSRHGLPSAQPKRLRVNPKLETFSIKESLVRRLLAFCAVGVTIFAVVAELRGKHVATVAAMESKGGLSRGAFAQQRTIAAADPLGFSFSFSADMSVAAPGCPLGPAMTFCNQIPGTISPVVPFTITFSSAASNVSIGLAAVPGYSADFSAGDFTISNDSCTGNFAANGSCSFDVAFSPTTLGPRQASLTLSGTGFVNIAGTGATFVMEPPTPPSCPGPSLPGDAFTYCAQAVGTVSGPQTFTVTSTNSVTGLNIAFTAIPGLSAQFNASDFTIETTTCGPALPANSSCTLAVAFTPTTSGPRSALLTATDSQGDSVSLNLSGSTSAALVFSQPITSACRLRLFNFCNEPQGGATPLITYTLQNNSGTQITGLAVTPPVPTSPPTLPPTNFTVQSTTCTPTLAAGASCTLSIAFTPQNTGLIQAPIIVTDAQGDIVGLNLAGTGDDYELSLASGQATEVTIGQGGTATLNAQVAADGVFGASGEMVMLACPSKMPISSTCAFTSCPLSMTPNSTSSFSIVIVTSSTHGTAPPVTNPCGGTASSAHVTGAPQLAIYFAPEIPRHRGHFPPLLLIAVGLLIAMFVIWTRANGRKSIRLVFAAAGLAALILAGCGGSGPSPNIPTPVDVYSLEVTGNALDASGNPLNASRALAFTLDVIAGP